LSGCDAVVVNGSGAIGLLGLVKALGEYLTSVEDEPRLRGPSSTRSRGPDGLRRATAPLIGLQSDQADRPSSTTNLAQRWPCSPPSSLKLRRTKSTASQVRPLPSLVTPSTYYRLTGDPPRSFVTFTARVLTEFYIEKLSDVLLLTPALQGLLTLSGLPTFGSSETLVLVPAYVHFIPTSERGASDTITSSVKQIDENQRTGSDTGGPIPHLQDPGHPDALASTRYVRLLFSCSMNPIKRLT
jgi:hypothetical protein